MTRAIRYRSHAIESRLLLYRIFLAALLAGLVGGLVLTAAQALRAIPLIHQAEVYEAAAEQGKAAGHGDTAHAGYQHEGAEWQPTEGAERFGFTLLANLLAAIGFALLLEAGYGIFGVSGWKKGLVWGLAGFAAFTLAPALGLPPELPGTESAGLVARQLWWASAAGATAIGLGLIAFAPRWSWKIGGALLIAAPHLLGAPHVDHPEMAAPVELSNAFVVASLLANLAFWIVVGPLSAYLFTRIVQPAADV